ncbi:hypothetical protein EV700_2867 [Fluviicoccus keumensis]|uniref:PilJ/NarX-like methyl-accepting chemotaxis transducer n=1 Tax=Fluviicoccus keumensis TaxID=1435465 RepID=A0A4Q7YJN5_9GAMM|nr:hypothetical protein EV700_2867 [Fluviicoccus keumensis]
MPRLRASIFLFLVSPMMVATLAHAAPAAAAEAQVAVSADKQQALFKAIAQLEVLSYRMASTLYLSAAQGKRVEDMPAVQKLRKECGRLAANGNSAVKSAWGQLDAAITEVALDGNGKPVAGSPQKITDKLNALSETIHQHLLETRKSSKLPVRGPADALRELAVRLETVVFNHLAGLDDTPQRQLVFQTGQRFENIVGTYGGKTGLALKSASQKWPVLREAISKPSDKSPIFIISRFHGQITEDLDTALEEQPLY